MSFSQLKLLDLFIRASLGLHEYDESRMCFESLLELQKEILADASQKENTEEILKATDAIKTTEKWLKKVRNAEIDYKKRDKNIGKRISKGLFEGKDAVDIIESKTSTNERENSRNTTIVGTETCDPVNLDSTHSPPIGESNICERKGKNDDKGDYVPVSSEVPTASVNVSPVQACSTFHSTKARPIIEHLYTYQFYYYSAIFVASIAIGLQII